MLGALATPGAGGGVTLRRLASLRGHTDEKVWHVSWCPDGTTLASCAADKTIRLWIHSGGEPTPPPTPPYLALSPPLPHPTPPYPTLPHPTPPVPHPYPTLPHPTPSYPTLPHPATPCHTLPHPYPAPALTIPHRTPPDTHPRRVAVPGHLRGWAPAHYTLARVVTLRLHARELFL